MKLIALEEAFWYDKLATDGSPLSRVPVRPEVLARWQRRLGDFAEFRLPDMDKFGISSSTPRRSPQPTKHEWRTPTPSGSSGSRHSPG